MTSLRGLLRWTQKLNPGKEFKHHYAVQFRTSQGVLNIGHVNKKMYDVLHHSKTGSKLFEFGEALTVDGQALDFETRNKLLADICEEQRSSGVITGWRNELYPVCESFYTEPVMLIERAAAVHFGVKSYGVHMNGYVRDGQQLKLWVAKRAKDKATWPGKLDHLCAGGQPFGISPRENMIKECGEEAGIPRELAEHVKSAAMYGGQAAQKTPYNPRNIIGGCTLQEHGVKRDCLFVYDLELPNDFHPTAMDGEVESFQLLNIEEVQNIISTTEDFKDNCNLVIIDFLVRHGVVEPESPEYLQIVAGLRQEDCQ